MFLIDNFLSDLLDVGRSLYFINCNIDLIQRSIERADIIYESYFTSAYIYLDSLEEKELGFI
jgi:hypothetical protein